MTSVAEQINSMLKYFEFRDLPAHLQTVSKQFYELAVWMDVNLPKNRETDVAMRKLLECKDCAVRSNL